MTTPPGMRAYRALLRTLPPLFRTSYASEMEALFREVVRAQRRRGRMAWLAAWMRGAVDVLFLALRLRFRSRSGRRHGATGGGGLQSAVQDLHFSLRSLRRRPLFATVGVLTLSLAIGASTAMFSVVNGVLLKSLPYKEPGRLVAVWQTIPNRLGRAGVEGRLWDRARLTYSQYRDLSEDDRIYERLAAYRAGTTDIATLTGIGWPMELRAGAASASLLPLLGVRTVLGRWFLPEEEATGSGQGGAPVAVISHDLWEGPFGGTSDVIGRSVTLDDEPITIIGVLPQGFRVHWLSASFSGEGDPGNRDIWFPIGAPGWPAGHNAYSWEVIGRMALGVTLDEARRATHAVLSRHPDTRGDAGVYPRSREETRGLGSPLLLLLGATGLLLLIACGNIATLTAAELRGRRHELATRSAMGAGAWRIVRLLMTESLLLGLMGSAIGAVLAFGGTEVLVALAPPIPRLGEVGVDLRVLGFSTLLGVCAALIFGSGPSFAVSRGAVGSLSIGAVHATESRHRFSGAVLGIEIALTVVLLVAGGLLTRSLTRLLNVDPGFDAKGLATVEVRLPFSRYPLQDPELRAGFFQNAINQLEGIPGIGSVSGTSRLPFPGQTSNWSVRIPGREEWFSPLGYQVGPGYLETLGVPLLAGRALAKSDGPDASLAVVINETMARRYWPGESPVGHRLEWNGSTDPLTVVGVVGDMKRQALSADAEPAFFIPFAQHPDWDICFVARTRMDPPEAIPLMGEAVRSVDPELAVRNATTVAALVEDSASQERYRALLMNAFGILATILAAAGVIGVTARSVSLRTREMGIRMALGAQGSGLVKATIRDNLRIGLAGMAIGLLGASWASRLLSPFLFGIEASDLPTYATVILLIGVLSLSASYIPARRISRVDPVDVLRAE
jgi:predicted permease